MAHSIFIIGAGNVGTGLALALRDTDHELLGIWNRGDKRRKRAESLTGATVYGGELKDSPLSEAGIVLMCVSDEAIPDIAVDISDIWFSPGAVLAHTSGCLSSEMLSFIAGVARGSLHPLCACPDPERAGAAMRTALIAVEGEPDALIALTEVARALSGRVAHISSAEKTRYHAAAVLASNLTVALMDIACEQGEEAGLRNARHALVDLAMGALEQVRDLDIANGITGPVVRGDHTTVRSHMDVLDGEAAMIYRALSKRAIQIAIERGMDPQTAAAMRDALKDPDASD